MNDFNKEQDKMEKGQKRRIFFTCCTTGKLVRYILGSEIIT